MSAPADNTVAWFEIGAADVDAAKAFYGQLFGWSFAPDGAYTLITAPGAAGPSGGIFNTGGNFPPYGRRRADEAGGRHGGRLPHRPQRQHVRPVQPKAGQLNS